MFFCFVASRYYTFNTKVAFFTSFFYPFKCILGIKRDHILNLKGVKQETRPLEILTNMDFKVLYRKENPLLTTSVNFCTNNFEFIQNLFFMGVDKKKFKKNIAKKIIMMFEDAILNTLN